MKAIFVIVIIIICAAGIIYLNQDETKPELHPNSQYQSRIVPPQQSGVLPKEKEVLNWLARNGCQVKRLTSFNFDNETVNGYSISWVYTVSGPNGMLYSGGETYKWNAYSDTYDKLIKIKETVEKLKRTGTVSEP